MPDSADNVRFLQKHNPCPYCGGNRFVPTYRGNIRYMKPCVCYQSMVLERRMTAAGIPQEFWDADLERIDPSIEAFIVDKENNRDIPVDLRVFGREYVSKIKELRSRGGGVFVQGKVDCGKTYFACAILKEALGDGWSGAFYTVEQYLDALKTAYEDEQTKIRLRQQREKAQIWVMDDLGAEYLGSDDKWALARLDDFFRWADSQRRLVIVTTNILSKEVLTERYHQRIVSIFKKYINTFINHPTGFRAKQGQTTLNLFLKDANKYP